MSEKIHPQKDFVTTVCTLYHSLQLYEDGAGAFIQARNHGVEGGLNNAQGEIRDLIAKVEEVEGLKNQPLFKNCIDRLMLVYNLK